MTDAQLIARLREIQGQAGLFASTAAVRIEALTEQLDAARQDAKEAEAYAEELEAKLATCEKYRDAYAEMERVGTQAVRDLEAKLAECEARLGKAVEATVMDVATRIGGMIRGGDETEYEEGYNDAIATAERYIRATLAELKGESHE